MLVRCLFCVRALCLVSIGACSGSLDGRDDFEALLAERSLDNGAGGMGAGQSGQGATGGSGGQGASGGSGGQQQTDDASTTMPLECGDVVDDIFGQRCASLGCHQSAAPAAGLDLESSGFAGRLEGAAAAPMCDGEVLIDTNAPENSLLYTKLLADPPCGERMPYGSMLDEQAQACVLAWIEQGAPD